jgi:hypothetical protein
MRKWLQASGFSAIWRLFLVLPMVLLTLIATNSANAESSASYTQMLGEELNAVFNETTMVGEYRTYRTLTETFDYSEFHFADGSTDYTEGKRTEKGIWSLVGEDKICYRYPGSEYYNQTYCFFVYESEGCFYKYSLVNMTLRGPRSWDAWSSRAIRKGSGATCAAPTS